MKPGPERLKRFQDIWPTDKGTWIPGKNVLYREKQLLTDFTDKSWMTLLMYGVKGQEPSANQAKLAEIIWTICASYPDPRLWNNRICALAGTTRSTGPLAIGAATAVSEATIYGRKPDLLASYFLQEISRIVDESEFRDFILSYLKKHRRIPGFGRPVINKDERVAPLLASTRKLLGENLRFIDLISRIESVIEKSRYRFKANVAIYGTAIMLEMGYTPREIVLMGTLMFSAGMFPCYIDALEKPEGTLFPLKCNQINYIGQAVRSFDAHDNKT